MAVATVRRRVLLVVNAEWYFVSHRLGLARALKAQGYEVVVAASVEREAQDVIEGEGFRFVALNLRRRSTGPRQELRTLAEFYRLYRHERPDLVHHVSIKPVVYGSLAAKAVGVPAVINAITGLGTAFGRPGLRGSALRWGLTVACRAAFAGRRTRVIFQNPDDLTWFVRRGVVASERALLIRGAGVDVNRFRPAPGPAGAPIVMLASRLLWDKGVGEFVEASRRLKESGLACRFVLVGVPDDENPNSIPLEVIRGWQAESIVEWWGLRDDMASVLQSASVVALPSYREGLPKVLLEAAACGRALIATDVPGCREVVSDGDNGLLVPPRDPVALAAAIDRLLRHGELRARMGERSRAIVVSGFSEDQTIEATLAVYRELLGDGHDLTAVAWHNVRGH